MLGSSTALANAITFRHSVTIGDYDIVGGPAENYKWHRDGVVALLNYAALLLRVPPFSGNSTPARTFTMTVPCRLRQGAFGRWHGAWE